MLLEESKEREREEAPLEKLLIKTNWALFCRRYSVRTVYCHDQEDGNKNN
jgi:hypothetical protein